MKLFIYLIVVILVSACYVSPHGHALKQNDVRVSLVVNEKLPALSDGHPQLARTTVGDGFCVIELTQYPKCLLHEIRHCFEGNWHEGRETTQNC